MRKISLLIFVLLLATLTGCKDKNKSEPTPPKTENAKANHWVYVEMNKSYLWRATMKDEKNMNVEATSETFFEQLRYGKKTDINGDRFSYVEKIDKTKGDNIFLDDDMTATNFGFSEMSLTDKSSKIVYCSVMSVVPGSPADVAGLKKGDVFFKVNGQELGVFSATGTLSTFHHLKATAATIKLEVLYPTKKDVEIHRGTYTDNPIIFDSIYNYGGASTALFVYNHFSEGGSGKVFEVQMKERFKRFKNAGVANIIVDLRRNGGGLLSISKILASLLVDKTHLGQTFAYIENNQSFGVKEKFTPYLLHKETDPQISDAHPNARQIYILTSGSTASASELVIHTLRGLMGNERIKVVGGTTVGKNLGGITQESVLYNLRASIISLRIYDINKVSGYEAGLEPTTGYKITRDIFDVKVDGIGGYNYLSVYGRQGDTSMDVALNKVMHELYPNDVREIVPVTRAAGMTEFVEREYTKDMRSSELIVDELAIKELGFNND